MPVWILIAFVLTAPAQAETPREYTAAVLWGERITLSTPLIGTVAESRCREGALVRAGELVYRLDTRAWAAEKAAAEKALTAARLDFEEAEREWERVQELYADDLIADQERRQAQIARARAAARLAEAEARLAGALQRLDQARVTAPRGGRLIACHARIGEALSGALRPARLAEMVVGRSREVEVNLLEHRPLDVGQTVRVEARGKTYRGRVVRVERERIDDSWRTWARVRFEADEELPLGERVTLRW